MGHSVESLSCDITSLEIFFAGAGLSRISGR
jgi:hypothetical protein